MYLRGSRLSVPLRLQLRVLGRKHKVSHTSTFATVEGTSLAQCCIARSSTQQTTPSFSEGLPLRRKGMDLRTFSSVELAAEHNWTHPRELGGSDFTGPLLSGGLRVWGGSWGFGN